MQRTLSYIAVATIMSVGLALGCKSGPAPETAGSTAQTTGEEGSVTTDSDGKAWVTPDVGDAREKEAEDSTQEDDETGLVSPTNVPGTNEVQ